MSDTLLTVPKEWKDRALIDKAKKIGGSRWAEEAHFFCEAPRANSPSDPPIEPTTPPPFLSCAWW